MRLSLRNLPQFTEKPEMSTPVPDHRRARRVSRPLSLGLLLAAVVLGAVPAQAAANLDKQLDRQLRQARNTDVLRVIVTTTPGAKPAEIARLKGLGGTVLYNYTK